MQDVLFDQVPFSYLNRVINEIFPGLQMFARDANLTPEQASWYVPGNIICERGFTDATSRFMGMSTAYRITILSNHMRRIGGDSEDPEVQAWELHIAQRGSHFKVLDVFEHQGKTQILLLHLPDDENWRLFEQIVLNMEETFVTTARERFTAKCESEVIPELATRRWLDRVSYPIGFLDDGTPQALDVPIGERLRPIGEVGFRSIAGSVVLLPGMVNELATREGSPMFPDGYPDLLAYGYIDVDAGLCVHALTSARVADNAIEWAHDFDDRGLVVRLTGFEEAPVAQIVDGALSEFAERIAMVDENYAPDEELAELRKLRFIDHLRYPTSPDDILAILLSKGGTLYNEEVWLRLRKKDEDAIYAELLNEPQQDLGIHSGDLVPVAFADTDHGPRALVFIDDVVEANEGQGRQGDAPGRDTRIRRTYAFCVLPETPITADEYLSSHEEEIIRRMEALIQTEAPIERTWLCNRVRASFGIGRSGRLIQHRNDELLARVPHNETKWNGTTFLWREDQEPTDQLYYRIPGDGVGRESNQIPYEEIVLAMLDTIPHRGSLSDDMLIRETARAFGFTRVAGRIREVFGLAILDAVKQGILVRLEDGTVSDVAQSSGGAFVFADGVQLAAGELVREGYEFREGGFTVASVSYEKLQGCVNYYLCAQEDEHANVVFFLETPSSSDEEERLRKTDQDPMHSRVYYSALLNPAEGMALVERHKDVLLNDGLISFGFFSNDTQSQISVDKYKVVTMVGIDPEVCERIFDTAGVPAEHPVTAWDTISPQTPGKVRRVEFEGKTIDTVINELTEDFGLEFARYVEEG